MTDYVRVRDKETGHHVSIPRAQFEHEGSVWAELKQDAVDAGGEPLPPKFRTSVSEETGKATSPAADTEKEK